ncbi:serine/threonine-protein kinase [Actinomadura hibisca]|uniref:serine/threonine-protein kinase n=1 Tax=Actinomadura hibisca TaxID=68565 RepID=UPI00082F0DF6|nr:serine/threonine-protein kinase [Actinomadura hibisca]
MGVERREPLAGRYRLLEPVGSGGMGTVWRAYDQTLDREVAIKEVRLPPSLPRDRRRLLCRRLLEEARATAALRHPGVVAVHDVLDEDERPWIVMEYLNARSLHRVLAEDGPLPPERAAEVGAAVLAVLCAAHAAGILHRDVKPSNVLLCRDGRILLTDFGLAAHTDRGRQIPDTLVDGIEGSPAYLPPERVRGEPSVPASDLWALGAMLYAAVEGRSPFLRCHALASMVAVLLGEYPPPDRAGALAPVIVGLLREDPADRLTAGEASRLLEATPAAEARAGQSRLPRMGAVAGVAALAGAVIVVGAWSARWNSVGQSEAVAVALPPAAGTVTYREHAGYAVEVPAGWRRTQRGGAVQWDEPGTARTLRITPVRGDALTGLRDAERSERSPDYRRLRLEAVPELAGDAAEWEFRTGGTHELRSRAGGYEFAFRAPDARWTPSQRLHDRILKTFRPGGGS